MVTASTIVSLALAQQQPEWDREIGHEKGSPLPPSLQKPPQGFGLGFHIGVPTGLDFSYKTGRSVQQAALGWNVSLSSLRLSADQLWSFYQHEPEEGLHFPVYVGVGGFAYINEQSQGIFGGDTYRDIYGIRIPVSMAVNHDDVAIDAYIELVPSISIFPSTSVDLIGGLGCRAYFF